MTELEHKTSGEIFEDVFMKDTLDNKNKLWISNNSLIKRLDDILQQKGNIFLDVHALKLELENKQ